MNLEMIDKIPYKSAILPSFVDDILNKKVAKIALNIFEKIIDWVFTNCFSHYRSVYQLKLSRIMSFQDGITHLYDITRKGVTKIQEVEGVESILLEEKKVCFSTIPGVTHTFSRENKTDFVVVKDDPYRRPGWFEIVQHEIQEDEQPRVMHKSWLVSTNIHEVMPSIVSTV